MKTYRYYSRRFGFEMLIPDGWSASLMPETIVGPNGKYLHVQITPLSESEPEPTIGQTAEYFDGLTNRQNLNVIATGTICVANKDHFWATYYRGFVLTLAAGGQMQFFKKYCLYLNRGEYLFTAGLFSVSSGGKLPTDRDLRENERVFDGMILSIRLMNA